MNKKLLSLVSIVAIAAPVATVIACGYSDEVPVITLNDMLKDGEAGWKEFLNDKRNHFSPEFIQKALKAIDWSKDPRGVIKEETFKGIVLPEGFKIPLSVTIIGDHAFSGAILPKGFNIPQSVISIGSGAFSAARLPEGFKIP